jgi:PHD/YefM family antitoxin component YafN of YafNO toxin-antitoxin module
MKQHNYNLFEFRNRMSDIINQIINKEIVIIERNGLEFAAIISIDDFNKFLEYKTSKRE